MLPRPLHVLLLLLLTGAAHAQPIYPALPDWESSDMPISTGGALVDINRDGWLDFVVANGNDINIEDVVVYYNLGDGTFPDVPDWHSTDIAYNGQLSVADVDGDGWMDVAVAILLSDGPGAKLYLNQQGTLEPTPSWVPDENSEGFSVGFGDVNGDGRPDLALGTGFPYSGSPDYPNYVYLNVNGSLESTASWVSSDVDDIMDVIWCDADRDGWLDLVATGSGSPSRVYLNQQGTLDTTASWSNLTSNQFALMATYGDVSGDGLLDLIIADNNQINNGSGRFRMYPGLAAGLFHTNSIWSYSDGGPSAVALGDLDADGDLDLATGAWFDRTRVFINNAGVLPSASSWTSGGTSVPEAILLGDVDRDGQRSWYETFAGGSTGLVYLAHQPIDQLNTVIADGQPLASDHYTFDAVHGWVSVGVEFDTLTVGYTYSRMLDLAVTNWDDDEGNYLYYNLNAPPPPGDANQDCHIDLADFTAFQGCFSGPILHAGSGCEPLDYTGDGRVDLLDFAQLQVQFTGSVETLPGCE